MCGGKVGFYNSIGCIARSAAVSAAMRAGGDAGFRLPPEVPPGY